MDSNESGELAVMAPPNILSDSLVHVFGTDIIEGVK